MSGPQATREERATMDTEEIAQLRHDLNSALTVLHARIQLLQRRLARRDGVSEETRRWVTEDVNAMLEAARALEARIAELPLQLDPR